MAKTARMNLADPFPIKPFTRPLSGQTVFLSGSKSITNRALILAALSKQIITLEGVLFSRDTQLMVAALQNLGFTVKTNTTANTIMVTGLGGKIPNNSAFIHVGNAGTVARLLTALLCLKEEGDYHLDGDTAMRRRPMRGLLDALEACGAAKVSYHSEYGHFPFSLKTYGFPGGKIQVSQASDLIISSLCAIAPFAREDVTIEYSEHIPDKLAVRMTLLMMANWGQPLSYSSNLQTILIPKGNSYYLNNGKYLIEVDAPAASYFHGLTFVAGGYIIFDSLKLWDSDAWLHSPQEEKYKNSTFLQGEVLFADVLEQANLLIVSKTDKVQVQQGISRQAIQQDFHEFGDTFLTLAAISPLLEGKTRISGISHTREHETDRVASVARELKKLLGDDRVIEEYDVLEIQPAFEEMKQRAQSARNSGILLTIDTYEDHRFAMSFTILGCYDLLGDGQPWLAIKDPLCCGKTFPNFFQELERIRLSLATPK